MTAAVLILSFLSSSVMPNAVTLSPVRSSSTIGLDSVVLSTTGAFSMLLFEKLKLICTFVGDNFGDSMSKSVFFVLVGGCVDDEGGAGTFIVADADVFVVPSCADGGDGIVNVAVCVSVFDAADDEGAVIVYVATTVSVDELIGTDTVLDALGAFADNVPVTLSSGDDLIVSTRSLVVLVVVAVDVVLVAEFSV